jgi:branched-chain amino acid transport system substrate-binding protein
MKATTRMGRPLLRAAAAFGAAGALVAMMTTAGGAAVRSHTTLPPYPTKLTSADISLAAKYIGGVANKAAAGTPVTIGFINDDAGTPAFPENVAGATIAETLINKDLHGIKGHPLAFDECPVNVEADVTTCANKMVADHVKIVLTGTLDVMNDTQLYSTLFSAHIPVIEGNSITTPDFFPPSGGTAVTYTPGSPGVLLGMAKFVGLKGVGGKLPSNITGFFLDSDTGSQTAFNSLFKSSSHLTAIKSKIFGEQIATPWTVSDVETALAAIPAAQKSSTSLFVPIMPVQVCVNFYKAMQALHLNVHVVTTGLCFGQYMKQQIGTYPNGWYFGDYGINYFMYQSTLATSQQLQVYIAAVKKFNPTIDYTGFAGPSFGNVMTVAKLYNKAGLAATSAQLAALAKGFVGPQWGISGPMTCGGKIHVLGIPSVICGKYMGMAQFISGHWKPIQDAYNGKLINAFT